MFGEMLNKIMSEYPTGDERKEGFPYIEAHHIVPLSNLKLGEKRKWDPKNDFKVLCANCHRMIHKKNPPLSLEELKKIIN
tara:strand:+ start:236 stop:475 length:240 start_codon:yes stop_codon:yes gene_type:complete